MSFSIKSGAYPAAAQTYSHSLSMPSESAGEKYRSICGLKPAEYSTFTPARVKILFITLSISDCEIIDKG